MKGDFIKKINGIPINSIKQVVDIIYQKQNTKISIETGLGKKCILPRKLINEDNNKMK